MQNPPDRNESVQQIETNVVAFSFFSVLADDPRRGRMKASPTEKERSRQRGQRAFLCSLNAIIILSIQAIFGNKNLGAAH